MLQDVFFVNFCIIYFLIFIVVICALYNLPIVFYLWLTYSLLLISSKMVTELRTRKNGPVRLSDKELIEQEEYKEVPALDQEDNSNMSEEQLTYSWKWRDLVWRNVILLGMLHILSVYAWIEYMINPAIKWQTCVATFVFGLFSSSMGITAGAHRLWAHRSYKAKWPLR